MLRLSIPTTPKTTTEPPEHHVLLASATQAASGWASYLPSWAPSPGKTRPSLTQGDGEGEPEIVGFRNPWPSWKKPTISELWQNFQWGEDDDACVELATSHLADTPTPQKSALSKQPSFHSTAASPTSFGAKAAQLLRIEDPNFSFPPSADPHARAKVTWLGHASLLVQLPSLGPDGTRPLGCLFDPIFTARCSPSELAGPIRSYPAPCRVEDLPPIDVVCISHNHQDHMSELSLLSIWRHNKDSVRFFVPLRNKKHLLDFGIPADRIHELDWWDSADLTHPSLTTDKSHALRIRCTPAQHSSIRSGNDVNSALWSSWYLEHLTPSRPPFRVFFAGDTGYQHHPSPSWPPSPNDPPDTPLEDAQDSAKHPACPAFAEIRQRIGPPHLLLLPISVGATFAYLRSFVPLPDWINPFPRHTDGVTAANHMPPWDAVRVMNVMTEGSEGAVAVGMHWGTFVTDPVEVLKTLGGLEWACKKMGVRFGRGERKVGGGGGKVFLALNHGGSLVM